MSDMKHKKGKKQKEKCERVHLDVTLIPTWNMCRVWWKHLYIYPPWWSRRRGSCQRDTTW